MNKQDKLRQGLSCELDGESSAATPCVSWKANWVRMNISARMQHPGPAAPECWAINLTFPLRLQR